MLNHGSLVAVKRLLESYVPKVRAAIANLKDVYIPGENWELFEAAVIFYAISEKCKLPIQRDVSKYWIKTLGGADYSVSVNLDSTPEDPEYQCKTPDNGKSYNACGSMTRGSQKYQGLNSWSIDSRFCSREGAWQNNKVEDYEALYEWMTGAISDSKVNEEKVNRLRERKFLSDDNKVNIMVVKSTLEEFDKQIPSLDKEIQDEFADIALDISMESAKQYPPQIQDLQIFTMMYFYIGNMEAMMVLDELYDTGVFKPLSENEKVTSQLIMFADRLPG